MGATGTADQKQQPRGPAADDYENHVGYGLFKNPNLFRDPGFYTRAAKVFADAGMGEQGMAWLQRGAQAAEENGLDALKRLAGGDVRGAEQAFNASGRMKVVAGSTQEMPGGKYRFKLEDGSTQTVDPQRMLRSFLTPKDYFSAQSKDRELDIKDRGVDVQADNSRSLADFRTDSVARQDRAQQETARHNRASEGLQAKMLKFREERGGDAGTAMTNNIDFMVKNGIAKDPAEAFTKLHTAVSKSDDEAVRSVASNLMKGSSYRGRDGANHQRAEHFERRDQCVSDFTRRHQCSEFADRRKLPHQGRQRDHDGDRRIQQYAHGHPWYRGHNWRVACRSRRRNRGPDRSRSSADHRGERERHRCER
jgi:hypothetical protein